MLQGQTTNHLKSTPAGLSLVPCLCAGRDPCFTLKAATFTDTHPQTLKGATTTKQSGDSCVSPCPPPACPGSCAASAGCCYVGFTKFATTELREGLPVSLEAAAPGSSAPGCHPMPVLTPPLPVQAATLENSAEPLMTPGRPEESRAQVDPAAGRDPEKTYDTGSIAPHAGLQQHGGPASSEVDAAHPYLLMQVWSQFGLRWTNTGAAEHWKRADADKLWCVEL